MTVRIMLMPGGRAPRYATNGAAGLDCYAVEGGTLDGVSTELVMDDVINNRFHTEVIIDRRKVPLGFAIEIPAGFEGQIRPRSGLGFKHGLHVAGGTIDSDYRGPVSALLFNLGSEPFTWAAGDRICQLVIAPVVRADLMAVEELSESERGGNGWGHSGLGELKVGK